MPELTYNKPAMSNAAAPAYLLGLTGRKVRAPQGMMPGNNRV